MGITANPRWVSLLERAEPHLYEPLAQDFGGLATVVVNTGGSRLPSIR